MSRAYRLYHESEVQEILRDRKIMAPPVTCYNRILRVSMRYLESAPERELEQIFREQGFWGNTCECCQVVGD